MAAAVVDLNINEGETFIMSLEFWEDKDNTIPIDVTSWSLYGQFLIAEKRIPMALTKLAPAINAVEARVNYNLMTDLKTQGKYDIEVQSGADRFRLMQGSVRVSPEVTI